MVSRARLLWGIPVLTISAALLFAQHSSVARGKSVADTGPSRFTKYAMNASNNAVIETAALKHWNVAWTYSASTPLQQASFAQGVIYVSGDGMPGHHALYAFNAQTGQKLWARPLDNMSMTTPVVAHGLVFVGTGNQAFSASQQRRVNRLQSRNILRGTGPNAIYALDARTGRVRWKDPTRGEDMPSFVYDHGVIYTVGGSGVLSALDAKTGALGWRLTLGSYVSMSSPAVFGHTLYVSGAHPYALYAINVQTHKVIWKRPVPKVFGGSDDSSIAVSPSLIYVEGTTGSWQHPVSTMFAFRHSGALAWQTPLGTGKLPKDIEVSAPVLYHGRVFVGSPISHCEYALNAQSGQKLWAFQAYGPVSASAALLRHTLYVGDRAGMFYALNAKTGQEQASRYMGGAFAADYPIIVGQTLYQPDENGLMLAFPVSRMTAEALRDPPQLSLPAGPLGQDIRYGETAFMDPVQGVSCVSCHAGGGTLMTYRQGHLIPSLLGAAASFPLVRAGHIRTLDAQINQCLRMTHTAPLPASSPRLQALNLYLRWLSSGWPEHLAAKSAMHGVQGGC
ncbi:MAG: PQQ-binding-like beta-propeller repeat protein [Sulfobacillus thermotolerans]|nr:PQQ-binding-like beta-propeller repeat protein [Sulfobacillus thermotolerans]